MILVQWILWLDHPTQIFDNAVKTIHEYREGGERTGQLQFD